MAKYRCHNRTRVPSNHELKGKTEEQKDYLFRQYSDFRCNNCAEKYPKDFARCGYQNKEMVKEMLRNRMNEWRPRQTHICVPRIEERNPKYRCEQCAIHYRRNFISCSHRNLKDGQSELGAFINGKKTITEPTDIREVK